MTALLLEDEIIASNRLQRLLAEIDPDIEIVATFTSIQETANYLFEAAVQPDILFLDIHVLDGNSMELFKLLDITSKVIFTTAYDEYAVEAFRKNATDYLLKPIKKDQLVDAISKAKPTSKALIPALPEEQYKSRFLIRFGNKIKSIKTEEIAYIFSKDKIGFFFTRDGQKIASDYKLQDLEEMLDPQKFFRLNRQFIGHLDSIDKIKTHNASRLLISLKPAIDEEVIISTERTRAFKKWMDGEVDSH